MDFEDENSSPSYSINEVLNRIDAKVKYQDDNKSIFLLIFDKKEFFKIYFT